MICLIVSCKPGRKLVDLTLACLNLHIHRCGISLFTLFIYLDNCHSVVILVIPSSMRCIPTIVTYKVFFSSLCVCWYRIYIHPGLFSITCRHITAWSFWIISSRSRFLFRLPESFRLRSTLFRSIHVLYLVRYWEPYYWRSSAENLWIDIATDSDSWEISDRKKSRPLGWLCSSFDPRFGLRYSRRSHNVILNVTGFG